MAALVADVETKDVAGFRCFAYGLRPRQPLDFGAEGIALL